MYTDTALIRACLEQFDNTHLARGFYVRCTAGTFVNTLYLNDTHVFCKVKLCSVVDICKVFGISRNNVYVIIYNEKNLRGI